MQKYTVNDAAIAYTTSTQFGPPSSQTVNREGRCSATVAGGASLSKYLFVMQETNGEMAAGFVYIRLQKAVQLAWEDEFFVKTNFYPGESTCKYAIPA
jgi:hypothetical protein